MTQPQYPIRTSEMAGLAPGLYGGSPEADAAAAAKEIMGDMLDKAQVTQMRCAALQAASVWSKGEHVGDVTAAANHFLEWLSQ